MERALTGRRETEVERRDSVLLGGGDVSELRAGDIEVISQDEEAGVRALVLLRIQGAGPAAPIVLLYPPAAP
jgi:hypothetical protein